MKEAAGEANMTVIVVVLIGVVAALGLFIVPKLLKMVKERSCCTEVGGRIIRCPDRGGLCCDWSGRFSGSDSNAVMSQFRSCKDAN